MNMLSDFLFLFLIQLLNHTQILVRYSTNLMFL